MDLQSTFERLYPTGTIGGQCGTFAHKLVDFPAVGNSFSEKKRAIEKYGIPASKLKGDFRPGDVLITSEGTWFGLGYGHVAVVNFANSVNLFLTESNFKKDQKVTHNRALPKNSPKIYGVIRGHFRFQPPMPEFPIHIKTQILFNQ